MQGMNSELLSFFLSYVAMIVVSALKKQSWSDEVKVLITLGVSVVLGFVACFATGELNSVQDVTVATSIVTAAAMSQYKLYFQNTPLNTKLESTDITKL